MHNTNNRLELTRHAPALFAWYPPLNFRITINGKMIKMPCQMAPNKNQKMIAKSIGDNVRKMLYTAYSYNPCPLPLPHHILSASLLSSLYTFPLFRSPVSC